MSPDSVDFHGSVLFKLEKTHNSKYSCWDKNTDDAHCYHLNSESGKFLVKSPSIRCIFAPDELIFILTLQSSNLKAELNHFPSQ